MDLSLDLDVGFVFVALLGILGAALLVGGIVAYRGSTAVMARAFSSAGVVAGLAMWLVIASVTVTSTSTSTSSGAAPEPVVVAAIKSDEELTISEQTFLHLLLAEDVERLLTAEVALTTSYRNYKEMAAKVDPAQVANMDSWFGLTMETPGGAEGLTFTIVDFDSPTAASDHFEMMRTAKKAPPESEASFGGSAYRAEMNFQGIGSMLVVVRGDKLLSFNTTISEGQPPMVTPEGLDELAALVVSRL